jgi:hypothetical protein
MFWVKVNKKDMRFSVQRFWVLGSKAQRFWLRRSEVLEVQLFVFYALEGK